MRSPYETFVCLANLLDRDIFQALYSMSIGDIARHVRCKYNQSHNVLSIFNICFFFLVFERLLQRSCPALAAHFKREAISTDYYLLDWYMTMFARTLNFGGLFCCSVCSC
jgi:hypothetical protein